MSKHALKVMFIAYFSLVAYAVEVEEFPFIGVTVTSETVDLRTQERDESSFGLRWGKQTLEWRTMFSYQKSNLNELFFLEIDKILMDDIMGLPEFRPYIGFALGKVTFEEAPTSDYKGYFYGVSLGMIVYATDVIDADISYHHYIVEEVEGIDTMTGPSVALHYFY